MGAWYVYKNVIILLNQFRFVISFNILVLSIFYISEKKIYNNSNSCVLFTITSISNRKKLIEKFNDQHLQ